MPRLTEACRVDGVTSSPRAGWAFATADARDPDIIQVVAQLPKHAHAKLSTFTSQGLANTCWALATLGVGSAEDLTPFAREIEARADEFKPQVRLYPLVMFIILSVSATARRRLTDSVTVEFDCLRYPAGAVVRRELKFSTP